MVNYYLGTITKVLDPDLYHIRIDIPGLSKEVEAYPTRGEIDEPRDGETVLVRDLDPIHHSIYLYSKLKEDSFIGIRSRGKIIEMNEDVITIGIFNKNEEYERTDSQIPKVTSWIKIDDKGNIEISGEREITVTSDKSITVNSDSVTITGGSLTVKGNVLPTGFGPFCALTNCPVLGAPHVGNKVRNT